MSLRRRRVSTAAPDKSRAILRDTLFKYVSRGNNSKHERETFLFEGASVAVYNVQSLNHCTALPTDCMCWFKSAHDTEPSKLVPLTDLKHPPRPKLNEHGVPSPLLFLLLTKNNESILFEARDAATRDKWVHAVTFRW